jgi:plastocyanin
MRRLLVLLPLSLLLASWGGSSRDSSGAGGPVLQTIQISAKEYSLTPSKVNLTKRGTYEFKATSNGTIAHALEIGGNGVEEKTGSIEPGSSETLRVTFSKAGSYEVYCPIDGHRGQGMEGTISVASAPGGGTTTNGEMGETTTGSLGY